MSSPTAGTKTHDQHVISYFPPIKELPVLKLLILFRLAFFIGSLIVNGLYPNIINERPHQLIIHLTLKKIGLEHVGFSSNAFEGRSCYLIERGYKTPINQLPQVELRLFLRHGQLKLVGF